MIKSIFVPLQGHSRDTQALKTAYALAQTFEAHLDCLHVRQDPRLLVASTTAGMETGLGTGVFTPELWNVLVEADKQQAKAARASFDAFCKSHDIATTGEGLTASFRETEGDIARATTANARYADLAVFTNDSILSETSLDGTGAVITGCGRPILLACTKKNLTSLSTVVVAWKETAEAARAVTAAMPILAKAKTVVVLASREGSRKLEQTMLMAERMAALLRRHGIAARAEHVPADSKDAASAVVDRAIELKADLLVMGAYGHNRLREFVFGGFTRHVLNETKLPVLMTH